VARSKENLIAALDVGSSKICCFIAAHEPGSRPRIVGIGHQISKGLKRGTVTDMDALELSILNAVHGAEQMAGETIRSVILNLSGGLPRSIGVDVKLEGLGHGIQDNDINRLLEQANEPAVNGVEHELVHFIPTSFSVDGHTGIQDPRGMYADKLGAHILTVSAQKSAVRNLITCVNQCHLDVEDIVISPYASGLSTLMEDELDLGATLIDMGGGVTSIAVFESNKLFFADVAPVGGNHVTSDIATGLSTPAGQAERLKTLYGAATVSNSDDNEFIEVPSLGDESFRQTQQVPKSHLTQIIQPRLEEILEMVKRKLQENNVYHLGGKRVVLTGGACQLPGTAELAANILGKNVRIGKPLRIAGLAETNGGPAFSTCAGLIQYALEHGDENRAGLIGSFSGASPSSGGFFDRLSSWFQGGF